MSDINSICVSGNMTRDPDYRTFGQDGQVCDFRIATSRYMGRDKPRRTAFVDCRAYGPKAQWIADGLKKGFPIAVQGHFETDEWEDKTTKQKKSKTVLVVDEYQAGARKAHAGVQGTSDEYGSYDFDDECPI